MIRTDGPWFKDEFGRTLILRGVNLGGSSKVPSRPNGATYLREGFFNHRDVSFVGRPIPLEEADEHFRRLRRWGMTFLRFLVTWEAVEHSGPGIYDLEYLDYLEAVIRKAGEHGLTLLIDPHEDVWSRFSGGDGAPGWTLEAAGFNLACLHETGAAILHQMCCDSFPRMIWPTNHFKLAAATMFTLFFGGNDFAPRTRVDGTPIQEYLQAHYIAAMQQLARRLKDMPWVVGYDMLNEPGTGYIGCKDLTAPFGYMLLGEMPTPFQSMLLGEGIPQEVEVWKLGMLGFKREGARLVNPDRRRAWQPGRECIWLENGVWERGDDESPRLVRPDHFWKVGGREVDFNQDYLRPFANRYAEAIRSVAPQALIFLETDSLLPQPRWGAEDAAGIVSAPHWYDDMVLVLKSYHPWLAFDRERQKLIIGRRAIRKAFSRQLAHIKRWAEESLGGVPTLLGEYGIPFDLNNKKAYRSGDFSAQARALDRTLLAMDENLLSGTLWNYTANNDNQHGDQWNDEDLSIFSRDQQSNPACLDSGGRALEAAVRPYASKIAGEPLSMAFDLKRKFFEFEFRHDPQATAPSEFFIPNFQYPEGYQVKVTDGSYERFPAEQRLVYRHGMERDIHRVVVSL